jgi:hypothetical protein
VVRIARNTIWLLLPGFFQLVYFLSFQLVIFCEDASTELQQIVHSWGSLSSLPALLFRRIGSI